MLQFYQEEDYANTLRTSSFNNEPKIRYVPHNKKKHSAADELDDGTSSNVSGIGQNRRRARMWVIDAIYMPDTHINCEIFLEEFCITCENSRSALIFGDDCAFIHILYLKNPVSSLFDPVRRKSDSTKSDKSLANSIQCIFWDNFLNPYVYVPHNNSILALNGDNRNSLVITNINKLNKPYIFRLYKRCECFDYNKALNVLITGSADYLAPIPIRFLSILGGKTSNFGLFPKDLYLNKLNNNADTSLPDGLVLACNDYLCIMKLGQDTSRDGNLTETHTATNSANEQSFHVLASVEDAEITEIAFADKGIITVGWFKKIFNYSDIISDDIIDDQTNTVELVVSKADLSWRGPQIYRDDILCLEHLLPINNLICTASHDDEINVWSIDTEK
ncbi:unnamed protein product [Rotaria sordida]|uniref:Uncharacterized protein n=1 Tax=Rotaria sordida TaxID=392033 RepID=A0A818LEF6_9BILA|nr:unnamed protein product [Rotaria sordida]